MPTPFVDAALLHCCIQFTALAQLRRLGLTSGWQSACLETLSLHLPSSTRASVTQPYVSTTGYNIVPMPPGPDNQGLDGKDSLDYDPEATLGTNSYSIKGLKTSPTSVLR